MKQLQIMIAVSVLGIGLFLSGCATTNPNLIGKEFTKETIPHSKTYFNRVWAFSDDQEFRVYGTLRLKTSKRFNIPDFVKVELVDTRGIVIESQKVTYYPKVLIGKRKNREAQFMARFNQEPPSGSVIRISNID